MIRAIIIQTQPFDVYEQMACDEIMCEMLPAPYILRFYKWKDKGITFGFSQKFREVYGNLDEKFKNYPITRRPTGGGVVIHEYDITFSFIFFSPGDFNPRKTYEMIHSSIFNVYKEKGFNLSISVTNTSDYNINNPIMECFKKPVDMDLIFSGQKVLGGALRKFSDYMLYQASLQFENARNISIHYDIIKTAFENLFNISFNFFSIDDSYLSKINKKKFSKYASKLWIERI
ncbi:MAG: hypothetical protein N2Z20_05760 [Elusimicrobiales bacterium]|nr:hypothetical protein [Elusimicrobiales bacterium]